MSWLDELEKQDPPMWAWMPTEGQRLEAMRNLDRLIEIARRAEWITPHDAHIRPANNFIYCPLCRATDGGVHMNNCPYHEGWRSERSEHEGWRENG